MVACLPFSGNGWNLPDVHSIFDLNEMINVWDTVSTSIHYPRIFLSTDIIFEQRIGQFTMDLFHIRFTYETQDNPQKCSGLMNWSSLWCLRSSMNNLAPV